MKKTIILISFLTSGFSVFAQDYPNWPAEKPETEDIQNSQSRESRLENDILPQEIEMQDTMRSVFTDMMHNASKTLGWPVTEISEYTNANAFQGAGTPYLVRSPRSIEISFQFIVNKDSLLAWKKYQTKLTANTLDNQETGYNNVQSVIQSPEYIRYQDSANYYMNLYTAYCEAHKDEGAALYTTDKHPRKYQQKQNEFLNKMVEMTDEAQNEEGSKQIENSGSAVTTRLRNHTVVQVTFYVNTFNAIALDETLGPIQHSSVPYPEKGAKLSRLITISQSPDRAYFDKWNNVLLILLGNFQLTPDVNNTYRAGFNQNGQGDEHTPKKIKSDKVQNISINIYGNKTYIEKMAKLIDLEKLNRCIVSNFN